VLQVVISWRAEAGLSLEAGSEWAGWLGVRKVAAWIDLGMEECRGGWMSGLVGGWVNGKMGGWVNGFLYG
jgi:hypothetical protein